MLAPCCKAIYQARSDGDGGTFAMATVEHAAPLVQELICLLRGFQEDGDREEEEVHHGT